MSEGHDGPERSQEESLLARRRRRSRRAMRVPLDEVPRRSVQPRAAQEQEPVEPPAEPEGRPTLPEAPPADLPASSSERAETLPSVSVEVPLEEGEEPSEPEVPLDTVEERLPEQASAERHEAAGAEEAGPGGADPEPGAGAAVEAGAAPEADAGEEEEAEALDLDEVEAVAEPAEPPAPPEPPAAPPPPPEEARGSAPPSPPPAQPAPRRRRAWFEEYFDDDYLRTVLPPPRRAIARQCDFVVAALGLEEGATVLDVGCGLGLQAIELARRGMQVVAMDVSLAMLARAAEEAQDEGVRINFLHADMREMEFDGAFDAVLCLGTTFGYFDDETNARVLGRFRRALKPGGRLLLDVVNRDHVLPAQPNLVWFEGDGCVCMEETDFNFLTSRLVVKRTLMFDDGQQRLAFSSVRLYALHELGHVMHQQGFRVTSVSGAEATPGVFLGTVSPRILMVAERPGAPDPGGAGTGRAAAAPPPPPTEASEGSEEPPATVPGDPEPEGG